MKISIEIEFGRSSGISYDFRDEFTTDRAAGAVNGTACEPGPGNRTVLVDSEGAIYINSGIMKSDVDSVASKDPSVIFPAITRAAGRSCLFDAACVDPGSTTGPFLGLFTSATPTSYAANEGGTYWLLTTNTTVYGVSSRTGMTAALNTYYKHAIVVRATGFHHFTNSSGGVWKLQWPDFSGSTGTLHPGFTSITSNRYMCALKSLRVPKTLWLPTPIASDGCGAAGTTDGLGHSEGIAGGIGAGGSGLTWTNRVGTVAPSGGVLKAVALSGGRAIATIPVSTANLIHILELTFGSTGAGLLVRYVDTDNYVYLHVRDDAGTKKLRLVKRVAGSESVLNDSDINTAYGDGRRVCLICDGTEFKTHYYEANKTTQTVSDAVLQSGAVIGVIFFDIDSAVDNILAYARGNEGDYARFSLLI